MQSVWQSGVLDPHGPVGAAERTILLNATVIMLAVVIPVIVLTLGFAWWFRAGNTKARYLPDWEYSGPIEMVVWSIPALVVMFLGAVAWIGSHDLDPGRPLKPGTKALEVQVVSLDWKWLFIYPEQGVASVNRLVVPAGTPLTFKLTSASVMNAFFVPQLGSMIYTMAGMTTGLNLMADHPGSFAGLSAHFSGDGFSDMRFEVVAVEPDKFPEWVTSTKSAGGNLDQARYGQLAEKGIAQPAAFGSVAPNLFDMVVKGADKLAFCPPEPPGQPPGSSTLAAVAPQTGE